MDYFSPREGARCDCRDEGKNDDSRNAREMRENAQPVEVLRVFVYRRESMPFRHRRYLRAIDLHRGRGSTVRARVSLFSLNTYWRAPTPQITFVPFRNARDAPSISPPAQSRERRAAHRDRHASVRPPHATFTIIIHGYKKRIAYTHHSYVFLVWHFKNIVSSFVGKYQHPFPLSNTRR